MQWVCQVKYIYFLMQPVEYTLNRICRSRSITCCMNHANALCCSWRTVVMEFITLSQWMKGMHLTLIPSDWIDKGIMPSETKSEVTCWAGWISCSWPLAHWSCHLVMFDLMSECHLVRVNVILCCDKPWYDLYYVLYMTEKCRYDLMTCGYDLIDKSEEPE